MLIEIVNGSGSDRWPKVCTQSALDNFTIVLLSRFASIFVRVIALPNPRNGFGKQMPGTPGNYSLVFEASTI